MAKTIANFLVGVGLDTKEFEKGSKTVDTALGGIRSKVGIAGSAITAAFSLVGAAAINSGKRLDDLALKTEKFDTGTRFINDYGNALRVLGGNADEAVTAIEAAESALTNLRLKGSMGPFQEAIFAGLNPKEVTSAKTGEEFLRKLADIVPQMSKEQQRLLQESFGFSDATMRSLRQGGEKFDQLIAKVSNLAGDFDKATDAARKYNEQIAILGVTFDGIGNTLAAKVLPGFTGILEKFNKFISNNQDKVDAATDYASENAGAITAIGAGATLSTAGAATKALGAMMKSPAVARLGSAAALGGGVGMAAGAGSLLWDVKPKDIEAVTGWRPNSYIFEKTPMDAARDLRDRFKGDSKKKAEPKKPTLSEIARSDASIPPPVTNPHSSMARSDASVPPPVREWMNQGVVQPSDAATSSPEVNRTKAVAESSRPSVKASAPTIKNDIALKVELGGRALESKITEVIERREYDAYIDSQSTEVR